MRYTVFHRDELPFDGNTYEFQGIQRQETNASLIWVDMPPGGAIGLHKHPYQEIFVIQEGSVTFTVDSVVLEAHAGQIILVPADVPHKFINRSDQRLKQIDIHVNKQFVRYWLEDET